MRRTSPLRRLAPLGLGILCAGAGCGNPAPTDDGLGRASDSNAPKAVDEDVLATVNGVPIRAAELQYAIVRKNKKGARKSDPSQLKAVLDELVNDELARQAAVGAGLDADPEYVKKYRFLEAPLVQFQREELASLYMRRAVVERGQPDAAELKEYFDAHAAQLTSELHLMQILIQNDEERIRELKKRIDDGAAFEEVAAIRYPNMLADGAKAPWDLGVMRWTNIPAQWREALATMQDGDVSDVIAGPNGRFWIVKLVERQAGAAITVDQVKPDLVALIQAERAGGLRQETAAALRRKAEIVFTRDPATLPPPAENDE